MFIYDYATGTREYQIPLEVGSVIGFSGMHKDTEVSQLAAVKTVAFVIARLLSVVVFAFLS